MRDPGLKWFMNTLIELREEIYGPMDDLSTYELWASNTPGVYKVWPIYLNTGLILKEEIAMTNIRIGLNTEELKKGDYSRPVLFFPCEFSRNAFYWLAYSLILKTMEKFINLEKKKRKKT